MELQNSDMRNLLLATNPENSHIRVFIWSKRKPVRTCEPEFLELQYTKGDFEAEKSAAVKNEKRLGGKHRFCPLCFYIYNNIVLLVPNGFSTHFSYSKRPTRFPRSARCLFLFKERRFGTFPFRA